MENIFCLVIGGSLLILGIDTLIRMYKSCKYDFLKKNDLVIIFKDDDSHTHYLKYSDKADKLKDYLDWVLKDGDNND